MSDWRHPLCGRPMTLGPHDPHSVTCPVRCVRYQGHAGAHECACQWGGLTNRLEDAFEDLADRARATLKAAISIAKNSFCDCPQNPFHRWNCTLTPVWAETMRDLDVNPWTVIKPFEMARPRWAPFEWAGERGTYCGRGPCCLGQDHDGRCRM